MKGASLTLIEPVVVGILVLAVLACVGWLGGGRKWAFRTVLAALALVAIGVVATLIYIFWTDKAAERQGKKIHECAVAKVAEPKCDEAPKNGNFPEGAYICPLYTLGANPTPQQEEDAVSLAEQECRAEMDPKHASLHKQISDYKSQHIEGPWMRAQRAAAAHDIFDQLVKDCAAKVRRKYPRAYDDLDDDTLVKKVLAKYPHYCGVGEGDPPGWEPALEGIH